MREQKGGAGTGRLPAVLRPALRCTSRNGYHHPDCHRSRLYLQIHKGKHANIHKNEAHKHRGSKYKISSKLQPLDYSIHEILNHAAFVYLRTPITFVSYAFALLDFCISAVDS